MEKQYISYNHIHELCKEVAPKILDLDIDFIIAIGAGGFVPARMLRTFLKKPGESNKRIFAIILSLYEEETIGTEVKRIQWINYEECGISLVGKRVLVVDEVDDTRSTIHYAIKELEKDAREQNNGKLDTEFFTFVLHNKDKPKNAPLPDIIAKDGHYIAARTTPDCWIAYPWEAENIVEHQKLAEQQGNDV